MAWCFFRLSAKGGATIDVLDETMAQSLLDQVFLDRKATGKTIISLHKELEEMHDPLPPPGDFHGIWTLSGALKANTNANDVDADAQAKCEVKELQRQFNEIKVLLSVKTTETQTATPDGCRIYELEERVALLHL